LILKFYVVLIYFCCCRIV